MKISDLYFQSHMRSRPSKKERARKPMERDVPFRVSPYGTQVVKAVEVSTFRIPRATLSR